MPTLVTRFVLAGTEAEVPRARRTVVDSVRAWGVPLDDDTADAIALVGSELLTNAVVHGQGPVTVAVHHRPGRLVIDVLDTSSAVPQMGCAEAGDESGRGLELVALLASKLAWEPCDTGKHVRAEIALGSSVPAAPATVLQRLPTVRTEPGAEAAPESLTAAVA